MSADNYYYIMHPEFAEYVAWMVAKGDEELAEYAAKMKESL